MSDIGAAEVSFLPRVPRLKIASTIARREYCEVVHIKIAGEPGPQPGKNISDPGLTIHLFFLF